MQDFFYARSPVTCYTMVAHDIHDAMVAEIMWLKLRRVMWHTIVW